MDARLAYWTAAWLNMVVIVALAGVGIAVAQRGQYERHRRFMLASGALVGLFVLSYAIKLAVLGREALDTWSTAHVLVLRVHELCVGLMLASGATAMIQAYRYGLLVRSARGADAALDRQRARLHRRAGGFAFAAALVGVLTAAYVLHGMYERAPGALADGGKPPLQASR